MYQALVVANAARGVTRVRREVKLLGASLKSRKDVKSQASETDHISKDLHLRLSPLR